MTKFFFRNAAVIILVILSVQIVSAQEEEQIESLFNGNTTYSFVVSPGVKFNSIQGDIGSLIEVYGGPLFNKSFLLGGVAGVNFGHPRVNYGYFGGLIQYTYKPQKLFHFGGQLIIAYGTTRDYEQEKSSLFDNFWNITGEGFFVAEPGVNLELNLKSNLRLTSGVSYRFVSGIEQTSSYIQNTHVSNQDMCGLNVRLGLVFSSKK